jgi:hypothetical protein
MAASGSGRLMRVFGVEVSSERVGDVRTRAF